jgi:hypothetical protein
VRRRKGLNRCVPLSVDVAPLGAEEAPCREEVSSCRDAFLYSEEVVLCAEGVCSLGELLSPDAEQSEDESLSAAHFPSRTPADEAPRNAGLESSAARFQCERDCSPLCSQRREQS